MSHPVISSAARARTGTLLAWLACLACAEPTATAPTPPLPALTDSIAFIHLAAVDGSGVVSSYRGSDPAYAPDGRIAFVRDGWVMVAEPLDDGYPAARGSEPAWSPDGRSIAFTDSVGIGILRVQGDFEVRRLVAHDYRYPGRGSVGNPAWSPVGSMIAFEDLSEDDVGPRIHVVPVDGSRAPTPLTRDRITWGSERAPAWSPDGKAVVFASDAWGIAIANVADGAVMRLWKDWPALLIDAEPAWTADGSAILFSYRESMGAPHALMRLDTGSTEPRLLVRDARKVALSRDGRQIAFVRKFSFGGGR